MNELQKSSDLEMSFNILTGKEKFVISYSFGLYGNPRLNQREIAFLLKRSQPDISQIRRRALRKMKSLMTD